MEMADANRGGARPGAGRPKGETTTMVRVPDGCLEQVRQLISVYRKGGDLPVVPAQLVGDAHKQDDLPLDEPPVYFGPLQQKAHEAWAVFNDAVMGYSFGSDLRQRYFTMVADADELGYSYLFCLQLLERLVAMPRHADDCPIQWANIRELRQFAKQLYRANPAWH
ncbi:hypothetical protein [Aeromonas taiwanensis]|uniref:hypothetical protein n=1 Tax=Aeromonas taiwanensis TaxID=633417 RepID=UPI00248E4D1A|nr:hypothetical protein [Aeromonas taiwanensis]